MDISTILGFVIGFALVITGIIQSGDISNFIDIPSIMIVVGGTIAATVASFPLPAIVGGLKSLKMLGKGKTYNPIPVIDQLVDFAKEARKDGLLALEPKANELEDLFFKRSIMMVIDAMEPEKVRNVLEGELESMAERHEDYAALYDKAASYAPAFGMIGTLIGLINMLRGMDISSGSADSIGVNMAVAMVTTFYGCLIANLILMPIASKLRVRNDEEVLYREIIIEGVMGIQAGDNPNMLRERLASYLSTKKQMNILYGESDKGGQEE